MKQVVLLIFISLFLPASPLPAFDQVDLSKAPIFVRQGFEPAWTDLTCFDDQWLKIPVSDNSRHPVQVRMLKLKDLPGRRPFSLKRFAPMTFSFAIPFNIPEREAEKPGSLGLFIGSIGVNWEIYLNGHSILREIYTNDAGKILHKRSLNNIAVELDKQFIKPRKNILMFKIIGDPTDPETGFYTGFPFFIHLYDQALEKTRAPFTRVLIFLYLLVGIYFLYLYKKSRQDLSHLFFGLFCVVYFSYKFSMDHMLIRLLSHTGITHRIELISLFLLIPMILGFFDTILSRTISLFSKCYALFALILILFCFFAPHAFLSDLLRLFQVSIPMAYLHIVIYFYNTWYRQLTDKTRFKALFSTLEGRLFMGITICFFIGMIDISRSMFYLTTYQLSQYVFFLLSFPMGFAMIQQFIQAQQELIDSQRMVAQSRQEAIDNLKRADKLKDEFLAATSHELKTPLHGIIGLTQTALEKQTSRSDPGLIRCLQTSLASARRLAILIDDLLDYSRLKNNDLNLSLAPVDLYSVTDVVFALLKPLADKKQITLYNEIPGNSTFVMADENRVYQILQNLVTNAIKFNNKGMVKIYAVLKDNFIVTSVKDSGIGIKPEELSAVFQSFVQLDSSVTRQYQGMGLGLSITRTLVKQHGGDIWVDSVPGAGSTFSFSLPVSDQKPDSIDQREKISRLIQGTGLGPEEEDRTRDTGQSESPATVLVVDDDPVNLHIVEDYLSVGYDVVTMPGGARALSYLEKNEKPDLILLDIMMPEISGLEVCQKIRHTYSFDKLPIIFLSAKNQVADLTQGFSLGANDYLSKPFSKDELLTRVRYHIDFNSQVETAGRRLSGLKDFCSDLKNFRGEKQLADVIHKLLIDQIPINSAMVFNLQDHQVSAAFPKDLDTSCFEYQADQMPISENPVIQPLSLTSMDGQGWIMKFRTSLLENYCFLLYRTCAMGTFTRADKEFAVMVMQEAARVKNNIQNFIKDETILKNYLALNSRMDDIYFIQADRQFCRILFEGERTFVDFDWSLGDMETYFDEKKLFRVHRSFMINPQKSIQAEKEKGSRDFSLRFTAPHIADIMEKLDNFQGIKLSRAKEKICRKKFPGWFK